MIMKISMPMHKRVMHSLSGQLTEQFYGKKDQAIYSVSRKSLNAKLIDLAERNGVNFHFEKECVGVDFNQTQLKFCHTLSFDFIFGADGMNSIIRKFMHKAFPDVNVVETSIAYGYKELTIHSNSDGSHKLDNHALHIWPRKSYMVIALPNLDGTFTCTLFAPLKGKNSFQKLNNKKKADKFFSNSFSDLHKIVPDISDQYFKNPLSSLGFVRCSSWKKNNTFLIGDACHATVPFYGQGMNAGFEDCYLLNEWINTNKNLNNDNLKNFLEQRIIDTKAMQDLSMRNHVEMRDKTADPHFLLQKKIEQWFSEKHPQRWTPLYSMVTFSHIGYHQALQKGEFQDEIMRKIIKNNNLCLDFSMKELEEKNIETQILANLN